MKIATHILLTLSGVFLLLGLPLLSTAKVRQILRGDGADAVSSASVVLDHPSGSYIILINEGLHTDPGNLEKWKLFFRGEDMGFVFEDISCSVAAGDTGALELARSFQSQLPEHQMSIFQEDATLLFSRADHQKYDILIASREFSDLYGAVSARAEGVDWIDWGGENP